jgi:hypothetical protein
MKSMQVFALDVLEGGAELAHHLQVAAEFSWR